MQFYSLVDSGGVPDREEFLARYPEIAGEIEELFQNESILGSLRPGTTEPIRRGVAQLVPGHTFGDYRIEAEIAHGGMGVVFRARHLPLGRTVALKVVHAGAFAKESDRIRFRHEAMATAALDHPNIVPVYDAGTQDGLPFIAMKFVEGVSLIDLPPPLSDRARWAAAVTEKVARAIAHAHERGVVHRDLKPGNVIVGLDCEPQVTDFGLARIAGIDEHLTKTGEVVGTVAYMAPEQALGGMNRWDSRVDLYGLGAILHHLLTGTPPIRGITPVDLLRKLTQDGTDATALKAASLPRDIVTICLRCLEKDAARRYATANALADDLGRFLSDRPIHARRATVGERIGKWVVRHGRGLAVAAGAVGAVLLALTVSIVLVSGAYRREAREHAAAGDSLYISDMQLAQKEAETGNTAEMRRLLDRHIPGPGEPDRRQWEWYYLLSAANDEEVWIGEQAASVCWSPDGRQVAAVSKGNVIVWEACTRTAVATYSEPRFGQALAWSSDGLSMAASLEGGGVEVLDAASGTHKASLRWRGDDAKRVAWSPKGDFLAVAHGNGASIFDARTGEKVIAYQGNRIWAHSIAWSPDGRWVASGDSAGFLRVWDPRTGSDLLALKAHAYDVFDLAWSPRGDRLVTASYARQLRVWDIPSGRQIHELPTSGGVDAVSWSPDGKRIAAGTRDLQVILWDSESGLETGRLRGHLGWVQSVAWSPDSRRLASGGDSVRLWNVAEAAPSRLGSAGEPLRDAVWSPAGDRIAVTAPPLVRILDGAGAQILVELRARLAEPIAWSPEGRLLAGVDIEAPFIRVFESASGREVTSELGEIGRARAVRPEALAWSPEGTQLCGALSTLVLVLRADNGRELTELRGHTKRITRIRWSPEGDRLASASYDGTIRVWDPATSSCLRVLRGHTQDRLVSAIAWSPDGDCLASGGWDRLVKVWDVRSGAEIASLRGHRDRIQSVDWSPDGHRIASVGDGMAKLWDTGSWTQVLSLPDLEQLRWHPGGQRVAGLTKSGAIRVLDTSRGRRLLESPRYAKELAWQHLRDALSLTRSRRFADSDEEIRKAAEQAPCSARPWYERARILAELQEPERAIADLHRALEREPRNPAVLTSLASLLAVSADPVLRDPDEAVRLARRAVEAAPLWPEGWHVLGEAWMAAARFDEALRAFRTALRLGSDPSSEGPWMAVALARLGRRAEALRWYVRARGDTGPENLDGIRGEAARLLGRDDPTREVAIREEAPRHASTADDLPALEAARKRVFPDLPTYVSIDRALEGPAFEPLLVDAPWRVRRGPGEPPEGWTRIVSIEEGWEPFRMGADVLGSGCFRTVFEVLDPKRLTAIDVTIQSESSWTAFLDGKEIARQRAGAGSPWDLDLLVVSPGLVPATCVTVDPELLAPGRHVLALRAQAVRTDRTDFRAFVRAAARLRSDATCRSDILAELRANAEGADAAARVAYLEARLLQIAGEPELALARFEACLGESADDCEPFRRAAECLHTIGRIGEAEALLREGLRRDPQAGQDAWDDWLAICFADLALSPGSLLARFPGADEAEHERGDYHGSFDNCGYQEDVLWLLERLRAGDPIRIHCGAEAYRDPGGAWWSHDRFARVEVAYPFRTDPIEITGTDSDHLYHGGLEFRGAPAGERGFPITIPPDLPSGPAPGSDLGPRLLRGSEGYRIPMPRGRHRVTVHFAETRADADPVVDVLIEGDTVLQAFHPACDGRAVAQARAFDIEVMDGLLDVEFLVRSGAPRLSALEIR